MALKGTEIFFLLTGICINRVRTVEVLTANVDNLSIRIIKTRLLCICVFVCPDCIKEMGE